MLKFNTKIIKYLSSNTSCFDDVFDDKYFIILVLELSTLQQARKYLLLQLPNLSLTVTLTFDAM